MLKLEPVAVGVGEIDRLPVATRAPYRARTIDLDPFIVETVAEAREAILRYAMDVVGHEAHDPDEREYLRLNVRAGGPTWEDLAECKEDEHYDPADPDAGMTCSYLLYSQGAIPGVGGLMRNYSVSIRATAPPEVWDHPTDQPCGLDTDDDPYEDLQPDRDGD